jgi:hypothetical protein
MTPEHFVARMASAGFQIRAEGNDLRVKGNSLNDAQRKAIRAHKPDLLAYLNNRTTTKGQEAKHLTLGRKQLQKSAAHLSKKQISEGREAIDTSDLLDWYRDDLPDIATMPSRALASIIEDYLDKRDWYQAAGSES